MAFLSFVRMNLYLPPQRRQYPVKKTLLQLHYLKDHPEEGAVS